MKMNFFILAFCVLAAFCSFVSAQQPAAEKAETKTFDKNGLSFNYPAGWELVDQSTAEMQQVKLTAGASGSVLIYVNSPLKPITTNDELLDVREGITERFIENIYQKFAAENAVLPVRKEDACSGEYDGGMKDYGAVKITGSYQGQPSTASLYTTFPEHRFINFVMIRRDKDNAEALAAWRTIVGSVKTVTPGAKDLPVPPTKGFISDSGGVLNGRAVSLPKPRFPLIAVRNGIIRAQVQVRVTIDGTGKVIEARAVSGAAELTNAAVEAAKKSRFSPTYLCGDAVKVTGIIIYNFVR